LFAFTRRADPGGPGNWSRRCRQQVGDFLHPCRSTARGRGVIDGHPRSWML